MGKIIVGLVEPVKIKAKNKEIKVMGKFDTGAQRTSIDKQIISELGVNPIGKTTTVNIHGRTVRPIVDIQLKIKGKKLSVKANISDRSSRKYRVLIGRDLIFSNFIVDISKSHRSHKLGELK
jgi:hypothetical protein